MRLTVLGFIAALPLALSGGCTKTECVSDQAYFEANVLPTLQRNCQACHNSTGQARETKFILPSASLPDFQAGALEMFTQMSQYTFADKGPLLLLKPTMQIPHEGLQRFTKDSTQYQAFSAMLQRLKKPTVSCPNEIKIDQLKELQPLSDAQTLRKAAIALAGRIPTDAEVDAVRSDSGVFDAQLDALMNEDAFYERVREWANDLLLTDRFVDLPGSNHLSDTHSILTRYSANPNNQVSGDYPNEYWYNGTPNGSNAQLFGNNSMGREPLELIVHVVRENRPFTEILTADYMMVNGYSAVGYQLNFGADPGAQNTLKFKPLSQNPLWADRPNQSEPDPLDYKEAKLPDYPHAGVLSSPWFLATYQTTTTNVNRKRARFVFKYFLATDVLRDQERPVDVTGIGTPNPTLNDANCQGCHGIVDPVAGAFQDFSMFGRHEPADRAHFEFMRPPGYKDEAIPADQRPKAIEWMAQRVASDPRFFIGAVRLAYTGVTGQKPLDIPTDQVDPLFDAKMKAFRIQADIIKGISDQFKADGSNFKTAIKAIVKSPLFRANDAVSALKASREAELYDIGTASLATPENMARKIRAVAGYPWGNNRAFSTNATDTPAKLRVSNDTLYDFNGYRGLWGGIDSESTLVRLRSPNAIIASASRVMGNAVSCIAVPQDFSKPIAQRNLFRYVEQTFQPEDENGFLVAGSVEKIRENIAYLHWRVLGEELDVSDPEIDRTYQLFLETWREGHDGIKRDASKPFAERVYDAGLRCQANNEFYSGTQLAMEQRVNTDPRYTVRAWMAVMSYLLSDHNFLLE